jgi:hypothetical protein
MIIFVYFFYKLLELGSVFLEVVQLFLEFINLIAKKIIAPRKNGIKMSNNNHKIIDRHILLIEIQPNILLVLEDILAEDNLIIDLKVGDFGIVDALFKILN